MMFMTPMPPTSSEIAAMPPSRTVRVLFVEFAVSTSDCWLLTVKSADAAVTPWALSSRAFISWYAAESVSSEVAST